MEKRCATVGSELARSRVIRFRNGAVLTPEDVTKKVAAHSATSIVITWRSVIAQRR
jgi:hypothetical protein